MSMIQCKGCGDRTSDHDTLKGYCMLCAIDLIKQRDGLLTACEKDLEGFLSICKTCASRLPRPCKCKWQIRIDELRVAIANCQKSSTSVIPKTSESTKCS